MRILVAPDKFKGSLTAAQVALHLSAGIRRAGSESVELPLADGGDGSVDAAIAAGADRITVTVDDALGSRHHAVVAFVEGTAVVEVANTCGLALLRGRHDAMRASSVGFGQALREVVRRHPTRIVLATGGSASTDGGAGLLAELGVRFEDEQGHSFVPAGRDLHRISGVHWDQVEDFSGIELVLATDVTNPLLGANGAAFVYAPQKGASPTQVLDLERGLCHLVERVAVGRPDARDVAIADGAGSAGGIGFAALLLGARPVSGAEFFLQLLDIDSALTNVDLVVTGEGSLDLQSREGKLVSAVAQRAAAPVIAVVGRNSLWPDQCADLGLYGVYALADYTDADTSSDAQLTGALLESIGSAIVIEHGEGAAQSCVK